MPAPWNESCPGKHLSFGSFAIPLAQNLSYRSHAIPLGFTPWNSFSACFLAKSDRIGGDRLDFLNRGQVIPLGREVHRESGGFTPHAPLNRVPLGCSIGVECLPCEMPFSISLGLSSEFRIPSCAPSRWDRDPSGEFGNAPCTMLAIPLGLCHSKKRFSKSSTNAVLVEFFCGYPGELHLLLSKKNRT